MSHVALQYATPQSGSSEQDYLAASADLSNVKDGEMTATFKLESLPSQRSTAMFGQPITLSKVKPRVTLAVLGEGDRDGIARQQVCPVTGAKLGSMGDPIKVLIGDQPLYLCCQGCVAKVKNAPETYIPKVSQLR